MAIDFSQLPDQPEDDIPKEDVKSPIKDLARSATGPASLLQGINELTGGTIPEAIAETPVGQAGQKAIEGLQASESVRARGLESAVTEGLALPESGITGAAADLLRNREALIEFVRGTIGDVTRLAVGPDKAEELNLPAFTEFGDVLQRLGVDEDIAPLAGLGLEIATDPLTLVGGGAVKKVAGTVAEEAALAKTLKGFGGRNPTLREILGEGFNVEKNVELIGKPEKTFEDTVELFRAKQQQLLRFSRLRDRITDKGQKRILNTKLKQAQQDLQHLQQDVIFKEIEKDFSNVTSRTPNELSSLFGTYVEQRGINGAGLKRLMDRASFQQDGLRARWLSRIELRGNLNKVFNKMSQEEKINLTAHLDGFEDVTSPVTNQVAKAHKINWEEIGDQAISLGVETKFPGTKTLFRGLKNKQLPHFILQQDDVIKSPEKLNNILEYTVRVGKFRNKQEAATVWDAYQNALRSHVDDTIPLEVSPDTNAFYKWLVRRGEASSIDEAEKKVRSMFTKTKTPRFGSLEFSRTIDIPFYEIDPEIILTKYYNGVAKRFGEIQNYGLNDQIANKLIQNLGSEFGTDTSQFIKKGLDLSTGAIRPAGTSLEHKISQGVRNFEVASKLGRAVVMNATQSKNTASIAGIIRTAKSLSDVFTREGQEFAFKSGAVFNDFTQAMYGLDRGFMANIAQEVLNKTGFSAVEKGNRILAALTGRRFADDMARKLVDSAGSDKAARKILKQMDIDPDSVLRQGTLTEVQQLQAARSMATRTQFRARTIDSPLWAQSAWGKIFNQFKNFIENEAKFIRVELINEARQGNVAPLARYATLAPILGGVANAGKEAVSNAISSVIGTPGKPSKKLSLTGGEQIFDDAASVGAFGMLYDVVQSFKFNRKNGLLALAAGVSDASELASGVVEAGRSLLDEEANEIINLRPLAQFALGNVPVVGQDLKRALESEAVTKRRFTTSFNEAVRKGIDPAPIIASAQKEGITLRDLTTGESRSVRRKQTKKLKFAKAKARATPLESALLDLGIKEAE